jgi:hypothetical protein
MLGLFANFGIIVLLPALVVLSALRLLGVRFVTAIMWAAVTMAVVSLLIYLTVGGVAH